MINRVVLSVLALVLVVIGSGAALVPAVFYESYGIAIDGLPNLASELRGTGMTLLLLGVAVAVGAVWSRWAFASAVVALLVFLGFALGRGLAALTDGSPGEMVVVAAVTELVLALAAGWVAARTRPA